MHDALRHLAISPSGFVFDPNTGSTFTCNETGRPLLEGLREGLAWAGLEQGRAGGGPQSVRACSSRARRGPRILSLTGAIPPCVVFHSSIHSITAS